MSPVKLRSLLFASLIAAAAAIVGLTSIGVLAQTATTPPPTTTVNFSPFIADVLLPALGTIITAAAVYGVQRWIGIKLDDKAVATVNDVMQKGLAYGQSRVGGLPLQVDVKSPLIADAANYALEHGPDALKRVGISPQQLAEKLVARWHDPSIPVGITGQSTAIAPAPTPSA